MKKFQAYNLGQIKEADIELGDFTVFVGPQASGKSILLQMMKLAEDNHAIQNFMQKYGFDWQGNENEFLDLFLGEGMAGVMNDNSRILKDGAPFHFDSEFEGSLDQSIETLFYIPAQRAMTVFNGWPKNFESFESGDPYVVKKFSEELRRFLDAITKDIELFPYVSISHQPFFNKIKEEIFKDAQFQMDKNTPRKRIMLKVREELLSYMAWSSGQREFMPLLFGIYSLLPPMTNKKRGDVEYVVIEEPEMGIHPKGIQAILGTYLYLIYKGYKVIISTHSPVILELSWAIGIMKEMDADPSHLIYLFEMDYENNKEVNDVFSDIIQNKTFKTYYFNRKPEGVFTQDISSLDPGTEDPNISDWGGLTSFGTRASEIVSNIVAKNDI